MKKFIFGAFVLSTLIAFFQERKESKKLRRMLDIKSG